MSKPSTPSNRTIGTLIRSSANAISNPTKVSRAIKESVPENSIAKGIAQVNETLVQPAFKKQKPKTEAS